MFAIPIVCYGLQTLKLVVANHVVIILFHNLRHIPETFKYGKESGIRTGVQIESRGIGLDIQGTDGHGYLCLSGHGRPYEEDGREKPVDGIDVATESAHDGVDDGPLAIVVYLIDFVHQLRPMGKSNTLVPGCLGVHQPPVLLVAVGILAHAAVDLGKGRTVEEHVAVRHQS